MTDFHDVSFPLTLAFGARGGPERQTDIVQLAGGGEYRNSPHAHSRRRYNVGSAIKTRADLHTLITFFEARCGQRFVFRFRDPLDHIADDEMIGIGDGVTSEFQLQKTYADDAGSYTRLITKPVIGSVSVAINGVTATATVDHNTGLVSFGITPDIGDVITAGFQFDVPVRFDTAHLDISLEAFSAGKVTDIALLEVIDHA